MVDSSQLHEHEHDTKQASKPRRKPTYKRLNVEVTVKELRKVRDLAWRIQQLPEMQAIPLRRVTMRETVLLGIQLVEEWLLAKESGSYPNPAPGTQAQRWHRTDDARFKAKEEAQT